MLAQLLGSACGLASASRLSCGAQAAQKTGLGLVAYCCAIRRKWLRKQDPAVDLFEPLTFLKHCHAHGAGGMQTSLGVLDQSEARQLRDFANEHDLFIDGIVRPPKDRGDLQRFEGEIQTASEVGVQAVRTVILPGRRYERFASLAEFQEFERRGRRALELAAPVVERHRVPLAVENHKDQRIDERVALFQSLGGEFIGACVDTGNSFALLDDPIGAVTALAPFAFAVHLKDQALREYEDGFLLGDIPLGQGSFDLPRMVKVIKQSKPDIRFTLELITRDALKVPCLTEDYWATMTGVPASDLARTLRFVRRHAAERLQQVSSRSLEEQVELEDANVASSLRYAREILSL
jgi:sugar phosphate isomerase/epimerase